MKQAQSTHCQSGQPWPLGATAMTWQEQDGVNFAIYAPDAHGVQCCLFDAPSQQQSACVDLPNCTDGVWHGFMPNLKTGQLYGLRAQGPYAPSAGHRFNDRKLLVDPYARELVGPLKDLAKELDYWLDESGQHQLEPTDNAARIPKARVVDVEQELRWGAGMAHGPNIALSEMVLYEAHVKGLTKLNPRVEARITSNLASLRCAFCQCSCTSLKSICLTLGWSITGATTRWGFSFPSRRMQAAVAVNRHVLSFEPW